MAASCSAASLLASSLSSARYVAGLSPGGSFGTHLSRSADSSRDPLTGVVPSSGQDDAASRNVKKVQLLWRSGRQLIFLDISEARSKTQHMLT